MDVSYTEQQEQHIRRYYGLYFKEKERQFPTDQQLKILGKKDRNKWLQLGLNLVAVILFGFCFLYNLTDLSNIYFYILFVVFIINVGMIFYQKRQINEFRDYLRWKEDRRNTYI